MDGMDGIDPDKVPPAIPPQPLNLNPETRTLKPKKKETRVSAAG